MRRTCNLFFTTLFLVFFSLNVQAQRGKNTARDRIYKQYTTVSTNEELNISNKFGSVEIETWSENKIEVTIEIETWGKNQKQADELLSIIGIHEDRSNHEISLITRVDTRTMNNGNKSGFSINYTIKMPKANPLTLTNKYGSTYIGDLENDVKIEAAYGVFRAGKLTGKDIELDLSFSSSVDIDEIADAYLDLSYPGNVEIDKVGRIELDGKYGKLRIGEAISLEGTSAYMSIIVDQLTEEINIRNKYASNEIGLLGPNFKLVNIDATHGSLSLGIDKNTPPFNFAIKTRFGSFKESVDNVEIIKEKSDYTSAEYEGKYKGGGTAKVYADLTHGSVRFRD